MSSKPFVENKVFCSDCNSHLLNYIVYKDTGTIYKLSADCPFCGGSSFVIEVNGKFQFGPVGADESGKPTIVDQVSNVEGESNRLHFSVKKR